MIGLRALYSDHVLLRYALFSRRSTSARLAQLVEHQTFNLLACQVGPFHLTLTHINSEMNCIAKNRRPDSQKLETRRRGENFNAYQEQRHIFAFFLFDLLCDARKDSENLNFILKQCLILSNVCVIIGMRRLIGDSHQDLMRFKNNKRA